MRGAHADVLHAVNVILERLQEAKKPVPREALIREIHYTRPEWSYSTAARRFRDGRAHLVAHGWPVLSVGAGFVLSSDRALLIQAARQKQRAARKQWRDARSLLALIPSPQPSLFMEVPNA